MRRGSKPPDLAGDLPILLRNNENLPTSRFGMKISRFISRVYRLQDSDVNCKFRHSSSRQNYFQFGSLVVNITVTSFIPQNRHVVFVETPCSRMLEQGGGRSSLFTGSKNRACDRESRRDHGKRKWRVHTGAHRDEQRGQGRNNNDT